jgi:4-diphosphocytidyl-2-C-methyl-D-erythritol kinase
VSVVQALSLADELTLEPAERDEVVCPGVEGPNLAGRALRLFREHTGWDGPPQRLTIDKRIPVAAGMGGGSSDAAATLRLSPTPPACPCRPSSARGSAPTSPASSAPAAC